jgi:hypothetical protein
MAVDRRRQQRLTIPPFIIWIGTGEITKRGVLAPKVEFFLGNQVG